MNVNDPDPYRTPAEVSSAKGGMMKSPLIWVLAATAVVAAVAAVAIGFTGYSEHTEEFGIYRAPPPMEYDAAVYDAYAEEMKPTP